MTPPVYFKQLQLGPMQNFVYLIGDPKTHEAAVIDPGWEVPVILKTLDQDGYRLTKAFVSHYHFDHVQGLDDLLKAVDIPVYAHREDLPLIESGRSGLKPVGGGEEMLIGRVPVTLIHTPGHSAGSQCFLVNGRLLSGDTLFVGACGRCDLPGGDPAQLYESLTKRLKPLDDDTILCPGHNYGHVPVTPLRDERRTNPFLRASTLHDFLRMTGFA
ncbi:MAG: MBL fold hydrolase [Candidatus Omnitrophica bacterium CG11_big_fil_rev_8_21_14_0_20_63_9]|nr:MAG: MBL fold hydrolase [Candidatus Omnitrophica bacterium CG11_big_fil_rev_8_21_14_0_20_63_9]